MVQCCPNCGSYRTFAKHPGNDESNEWFCSDCGESFELPVFDDETGRISKKVASQTAPGSLDGGSNPPRSTPTRPPYPLPEVVDAEVVDVANNGGEQYVAIYEVAGRRLVGSSLYDNVEQVKSAFESIAPKRLFAVRVVLPKEAK